MKPSSNQKKSKTPADAPVRRKLTVEKVALKDLSQRPKGKDVKGGAGYSYGAYSAK